MPSGAWAIRASSIQKSHSAAGTITSAFGNTAVPSLRRKPLMWSPWKWLNTTVSTCAGSKPAARKFAIQVPEVGAPHVAVAGIDQRQAAVLVQHQRVEGDRQGVAGQEGRLHGLLHLRQFGILDEAFERTLGEAVVDGRHFDVADLVAVEARRLRAAPLPGRESSGGRSAPRLASRGEWRRGRCWREWRGA